MSQVMIPQAPKEPGLVARNTPVMKGLALAPKLIIDQHFVARKRMNRLLSAVIDYPDRIGVGIGESTAILVSGDSFKVLGAKSVVVIDARVADRKPTKRGQLQSAKGIQLHVLKAGQSFKIR